MTMPAGLLSPSQEPTPVWIDPRCPELPASLLKPEGPPPAEPKGLWIWVVRALIVAALGVTVWASVSYRAFEPMILFARAHVWARFFVRPWILWALMGGLLWVCRAALWFLYRPQPPVSLSEAPSLTVVIPAFNEGPMVEKTIDSVVAAHYPRERLEIVAVDDGSRDDTWRFIERAARRHGGLVTPVRFPANRGKRAALEEGFRRASGEIVVTLDSDSLIERETLLAIAGPFRDPSVGAVAGKVQVYNRREGLIPRMLQVRFTITFDVLRAAQSTYRTVFCCPGALSAYRTSVVRQVLDRWMAQTFLGVPCTYGEDRALTNWILEDGYDTLYQQTAVVHTLMPRTYGKLCRMYLRWERSFIREEVHFARLVWKRPLRYRLLALYEMIITDLRYPATYLSMGLLAWLVWRDPLALPRMLVTIGAFASVYTVYYLRSERSWDFIFGVFYAYFSFFALFWIFPYALVTVRARAWLTR